jgi:hypothetical protein
VERINRGGIGGKMSKKCLKNVENGKRGTAKKRKTIKNNN